MSRPIDYRSPRPHDSPHPRRRGVVGVIIRNGKLLVIRRAATVRAPNLICFPGGGIESGESETEALVREMQEELSLEVTPRRRLWEVTTAWNVHLTWYLTDVSAAHQPRANPAEVAEVLWLSLAELDRRDDLLGSVPPFIDAVRNAELRIPGVNAQA